MSESHYIKCNHCGKSVLIAKLDESNPDLTMYKYWELSVVYPSLEMLPISIRDICKTCSVEYEIMMEKFWTNA